MLQETVQSINFAVHWSRNGVTTPCGLKVRFTVSTTSHSTECYSTIGGLVVVQGALYGLTSAHGISSHLRDIARQASITQTEPITDDSSASSSDSDASTDSGLETLQLKSAEPSKSSKSESKLNAKLAEKDNYTWTELELPRILAYLGRGTTTANYSFPSPAPSGSDFALVDFGTLRIGSNVFPRSNGNSFEDFFGHVRICDLTEGDVWIITSNDDLYLKGYLLEGDASLILCGTVMRTKKIQLRDASGRWHSVTD